MTSGGLPLCCAFVQKSVRRSAVLWLTSLLGLGCQTYSDQIQRSQGYYEEHKYEQALAVLRNVDSDHDSFDANERVRYHYLRGMTDYRLGYSEDARYYLSLARALTKQASRALLPDEAKRLQQTLDELNGPVYGLDSKKALGVLGDTCRWTAECEPGFVCEEGACVQRQ